MILCISLQYVTTQSFLYVFYHSCYCFLHMFLESGFISFNIRLEVTDLALQ